ncbi:Hypp8247 [Branchiostoma lanceolatum]|uniref:Hypp8247 protein n=1 Tax=Branchiostoma lanceolatum TaxID=7740 RepID=A0A8J9Z7S6_BRALA|nr:Hypp8247 [Branchiostoma lanceolatum]
MDLGERVRAIVPEIFTIQDLRNNNTYGTNGYGQLNSNALEAIYGRRTGPITQPGVGPHYELTTAGS